MKFLFIHQNTPAQFRHMATRLAADPANEVVFVGRYKRADLPGVRFVLYDYDKFQGPAVPSPFAFVGDAYRHGVAAAETCRMLKEKEGFAPDLVCVHPGWGEALFLRDVFPTAPILQYCEFFYRARGSDYDFGKDPSKLTAIGDYHLRLKNMTLMSGFETMDWGLCPTNWQWAQHPEFVREKTSVLHEGINTAVCKPDPTARFRAPNGHWFSAEDEIVTYVARNLEPYRGVHIALPAIQEILARRPNAKAIIVGEDGVSYGSHPPDGATWKENVLRTLSLDPQRVIFADRLPYEEYLKVLQISSAHIYLTYPFVLSWSMTEAMSTGCAIIGSRTTPVLEVLEDRKNGLLVDFFNHREVADAVCAVLEDKALAQSVRAAARDYAVRNLDLETVCLPRHLDLLNHLASGALARGVRPQAGRLYGP